MGRINALGVIWGAGCVSEVYLMETLLIILSSIQSEPVIGKRQCEYSSLTPAVYCTVL